MVALRTSFAIPVVCPTSFRQHAQTLVASSVTGGLRLPVAECQFSDKILAGAMDRIDKRIGELMKQYPGRSRPKTKEGLRGINYFIELPIVGLNVDAFGLILSTEDLIRKAKEKQGAKITDKDSFIKDDNICYKIDFMTNSSTIGGTKNKGSVFLRGIKGPNGNDSFKFVLEKHNDFSDLDTELILNAVEHALK